MTTRSSLKTKPIPTCVIVGTGAIVLFLCAITAWVTYPYDKGVPTFGDAFQGLSALFSGLAFTGLIYTALLQKRELSLQRLDLELTRSELEGQRVALNAQNETLKKQNFENTFFQLLGIQNQIVNAIDIFFASSGYTARGRDCFGTFYREFASRYKVTPGNETERIQSAYVTFFPERQPDIGQYFRNLYTLIKFVDRSDVPDKKFYTNIVRAQLPSFELALLFYNCLSPFGSEKFKPLVEKYGLLAQMPIQELLNASETNLYAVSAFTWRTQVRINRRAAPSCRRCHARLRRSAYNRPKRRPRCSSETSPPAGGAARYI
jgi:hypothetical protein